MTTSTQNVLENVSDVICKVSKKLSLQMALMLMSSERKNYMAITRSTEVKYHKVYVKKDDIDGYIEESVKFLPLTIKK